MHDSSRVRIFDHSWLMVLIIIAIVRDLALFNLEPNWHVTVFPFEIAILSSLWGLTIALTIISSHSIQKLDRWWLFVPPIILLSRVPIFIAYFSSPAVQYPTAFLTDFLLIAISIPLIYFVKELNRWWLLVLVVSLIARVLVFVNPDPFQRIVDFLTDGITVTISITLTSFVLVLVVGLIGGIGRLAKNPLISGTASIYVEVIRGIPLLVQLMFLYFAFPQLLDIVGEMLLPYWSDAGTWFIELRPDPFWTAVAGITICYGAYMTEIFRAGIQSISRGQMEAARSLGMNYAQAMLYVILPQAVRVILPPVGNEFVTLLKDSSLVSVVAVADMTRRGREFMSRTYMSLETWFMVALLYLIMTLFAARVVAYIEKRSAYVR